VQIFPVVFILGRCSDLACSARPSSNSSPPVAASGCIRSPHRAPPLLSLPCSSLPHSISLPRKWRTDRSPSFLRRLPPFWTSPDESPPRKGATRRPLRPHQVSHPGVQRSAPINSKTACTSAALRHRLPSRPCLSDLVDHARVLRVSWRTFSTLSFSLSCPVASTRSSSVFRRRRSP
jgi:hypothetical protein